MIKSLRYRLLIWFTLSAVLLSVVSYTLFRLHKKTENNQQLVLSNLQHFRYQFLKDQNSVAQFFSNDIQNQNFFVTGESDNLKTHYTATEQIDSCFINCHHNRGGIFSDIQGSLYEVRNSYTDYCLLFDTLVNKIYRRGFRDFGLNGELAGYLYELDKNALLPESKLTKLKLAERDYIYSGDTTALREVTSLCNSLIIGVANSSRFNTLEKEKLVDILKLYKRTFREIVSLDTEIGLNSKEGLKQDISLAGEELESSINGAISDANSGFAIYMSRINIIFGLSAFLILALAFSLSIYSSRFLVIHVERLTNYISELTKNNFSAHVKPSFKHSSIEIRKIYSEFRNMLAELHQRERQRDKALQVAGENEKRYRELADLLPQSIYETDRLGNITYANITWHKTFGFNRKDIDTGINLLEILNTDPNSPLLGFNKIEHNDFTAIRKDGSRFPATVYSDVIKKGMRVVGRRGIIVDASQRNSYINSLKKEAVRAINSDKHKSSFLANMSHEIRTPMNSIIGFTNMLASDNIPAEQKQDFVSHIQLSSEMLLGLIDDIIDLAKIEAGKLKIKKVDCMPVQLVKDLSIAFEAYKQRLDKKNIEINLQLPSKELPVRTDTFRLKQILSNLVSNAIKFTENGSVEIGLLETSDQMLQFYVKDTGIGMTREEVQTIFERYQRSKLSEEKEISGTGLGLAISKNLTEMLGGNMWVESHIGEGSTFTFDIPYIKAADNAKIKELAPKNETVRYNWSDKVFLVAEDDESSFQVVKHTLESTNAKVLRAVNGSEAIDALSFNDNIDLILMDLQMPVMNGLIATAHIKEKYSYLPIIAQTAFAMEGDRDKSLRAGCDDYITKPLNLQNLLAKIAQFVKPIEAITSDTTNTNESSLAQQQTIESKTRNGF